MSNTTSTAQQSRSNMEVENAIQDTPRYNSDQMDADNESTISMNDADCIYESTDDTSMEDTEMALSEVSHHDNWTQLQLFKKEINHIVIHGVKVHEGWYDERFPYIRSYSLLNWKELAESFKDKDEYVHATASKISNMCDDLLEEMSTRPNFNLNTYYRLIHEISNIWIYYKSNYMGDEEDNDIIDLISGIAFM